MTRTSRPCSFIDLITSSTIGSFHIVRIFFIPPTSLPRSACPRLSTLGPSFLTLRTFLARVRVPHGHGGRCRFRIDATNLSPETTRRFAKVGSEPFRRRITGFIPDTALNTILHLDAMHRRQCRKSTNRPAGGHQDSRSPAGAPGSGQAAFPQESYLIFSFSCQLRKIINIQQFLEACWHRPSPPFDSHFRCSSLREIKERA